MNRHILAPAIALALAAASGVAIAQTPGDNPKGTVAPSNQNADQASAKEKIQKAGITGVNSLERRPDGTWYGRGTKDGVEVAVMLDAAGNVSFQ